MSNIDKIRQEIERRKKENMYNELPITVGRYYEDRDLLSFLDTLPEQPVEGLKEAAENYAEKHGFRVPYDGSEKFYDETDVKASKDGFIAGAEWQKEQLLKGSPMPEDTILFQKGIEEGKRLMMKDAVKGVMIDSIGVRIMAPLNAVIQREGLKDGDKMKILIMKEEQK